MYRTHSRSTVLKVRFAYHDSVQCTYLNRSAKCSKECNYISKLHAKHSLLINAVQYLL
jgi:hypothetical protein